jgi:hypothetical protein
MVNIKIQACKQIHSEASQEDPRLEAGKYGHYPDTGLRADPQRGQYDYYPDTGLLDFYGEASQENPKLEATKITLHPDTSLQADPQ